ncbi:Endonuclease/exonuclease/phosphatase [Pseudarthrobacter chlorophenolicus A6]|uniref:Endonuclease/exonuclease/phosphatase n=1 Tax=Pseudarthrobacter chlorophenolicus (strain ATCC 700700 / DSM 12829 / CIP 107037 / JCM 12360 / KCTC 9906 / NCIMB 13794 / A6) TaxID=452863 RepID=B8HA29_PSECP|nr:endonuclease/exonuclease/phosphatase family protein [Pseudarthrobacter chlorophenolicus]ACL40121.1 Endonuclease/exonuclease/phosphatase [Pseudarthrobacter chlorophenolicus A6]SDQ87444.1 Metal-dependent hydrolase, endonuclease/exonuclease/phosphatase family [Pseudarthrobacter chlorophenolicus]
MTASGRRVPPRLSTVCTWLSLLAAVPVLVMSVFRAVGAEWPVLVVQLLAFTPWLAVPAGVALVLSLFGGRREPQVVAAALLVCQLFWLFPLDIARPIPAAAAAAAAPAASPAEQQPTATVQLNVMSINSQFGRADAATIVRLVREKKVALLAIQEHSQGLQERLATEGLDALLPHRISQPTDDGAGSAVYSSHPLEPVGLLPDTPFLMPTVRLTAGGSGGAGASAVLELTNVHTLPPVDTWVGQWRSDLKALSRLAERPGHRLLLGDFNATYDHAEFRSLLRADEEGLVDVAAASGSRLLPTWPMDGTRLPGIAIDHVVTSPRVGSSGYQVHRVPGTDHAAITATVVVPAA